MELAVHNINSFLYMFCVVSERIFALKEIIGMNNNFFWSRDQSCNCRLLQAVQSYILKSLYFYLEQHIVFVFHGYYSISVLILVVVLRVFGH